MRWKNVWIVLTQYAVAVSLYRSVTQSIISVPQSEARVFHVDTSLPTQVVYLLRADPICLPPYTHRPLCASRHRQSNTQKQMKARAQTPIHLSILGIQFSPSCFSSAFPNGWLNQLCRAPFKSSGMLIRCQRLVSEPGGNRVTGGERLTSSFSLIKIRFYHKRAEQKTKKKFIHLAPCFSTFTHIVQILSYDSSKPKHYVAPKMIRQNHWWQNTSY